MDRLAAGADEVPLAPLLLQFSLGTISLNRHFPTVDGPGHAIGIDGNAWHRFP